MLSAAKAGVANMAKDINEVAAAAIMARWFMVKLLKNKVKNKGLKANHLGL